MIEIKKRKVSSGPSLTCYDIYITRGDSAFLDFELKDSSGQPLILGDNDLVRCEVRESGNGGPLLFEGIIENNNSWHIRPEDTRGATLSEYVYDIQIEYASGDVYTFIPLSNFVLLPESTLVGEEDIEEGGD